MASRGSELEKILAKRRSRSEEIFENNAATPPAAHASRRPSAERGPPVADEMPEWLSAAEEMGIVFTKPAAKSAASAAKGEEEAEGELPPWLEAAAACGVVFYDPEGKEIVVPSNKVVDFQAGLESVRDFEQSWESCNDTDTAEEPEPSSAAVTADDEVCQVAIAGVCASAGAAGSGPVTAEKPEGESQREALKMAVQKRYFALLRDGIDPNQAAVQAILEAKGTSGTPASGEATAQDKDRLPSCGSSLRGAAEQSREVSKRVTVVA